MRQWAGICDVEKNSSPILGPSPIDGLYLNGGFGPGGFKATPAGGFTMAHALATGQRHPLSSLWSLIGMSIIAMAGLSFTSPLSDRRSEWLV